MNRKRTVWLALTTAIVVGFGVVEYRDRHPTSATLPTWVRGEFAASAERYAGRTVSVDSNQIRFSRGESGADVLPIEWIEEVKDARPHIRILNLHVRDGDVASTIKLIASAQDSSFRLQTMPDVSWRRLGDYEARAERMAARVAHVSTDTNAALAAPVSASAAPVVDDEPVSDTVISKRRFADRDPVAQDELAQVVKACSRYGCRIGISGLHPSRFTEFSTYLHGLGADSVTLSAEPSANTTMAILDIRPATSANASHAPRTRL